MSPITGFFKRSKASILAAMFTTGVLWNAHAADQRFPVLEAGGISYTNVLVTGTTTRDVFIRHAGGLSTLKVSDLDAPTRTALGFPVAAPAPTAGAAAGSTNRVLGLLGTVADRVGQESKQDDLREADLPPEIQARLAQLRLAVTVILLVAVVLYLPFSFSCMRLCRRAGAPSSFLVWLPLFKRLALFKAVNISCLWFFLGIVIPFVGACAWILCCVRLCETFQRTRWLVVPMLVPVLGWLVFIYLDLVSRADDQDPAVRSQERVRLAA